MIATLIGFVALFALFFVGIPLAIGLGLVGFVGFGMLVGFPASAAMTAQIAWDTVSSYSLAVLPMFVLMGNLVNHAGLSRELYSASNAFVGHRRGGLAMATIIACGGFAAVCGSSIATAATMSKIALPSMRRFGYSEALAVGSIASGGTLGIIIPPSVPMVIYASLTEQSVGKMFIAGIMPGILGIVFYLMAVKAHTLMDPKAGPAGPRIPWGERLALARSVWPTAGLFMLVIGGIYLGVFTAEEAAGIGAAGALFIALTRRLLTVPSLVTILAETARTTAMLMAVLIGALIFSNFIGTTGISGQIVNQIKALNLPPLGVMLVIVALYVVLGCVLESLSMILLTIPVIYPLVIGLGYDPIWFGILVVVLIEISLITPPIGVNLFVIQAISGSSALTLYRGVLPFIVADIVRLAVILLLPAVILFLPNHMMK
ncbi:MAG: TRAP transporter large permease [Pseudorhodoplanes sp.]